MKKIILVAGATGNLGYKIVNALLKKDVLVRAFVRTKSKQEDIDKLEQLSAEIIKADWNNEAALKQACEGVSCVVSALAGLHDVIIDAQSKLLDAAIAAGVPRFIPSDFSTDITQIPKGENRNFDLRKDFHEYLDKKEIKYTSIYNGAFADILAYNTPVFNVKEKTIAYYGNKADWKIDFTTMDETAAFTAEVALDDAAPQKLYIASFQVSANDLVDLSEKLKGEKFELKQSGSLEELSAYNKRERAAHPEGENQLYASWQQSQYVHSMFTAHHPKLDNDRYKGLTWTDAETIIKHL